MSTEIRIREKVERDRWSMEQNGNKLEQMDGKRTTFAVLDDG